MREIRVSQIASLAWCEVKAKAVMDGFKLERTYAMEEGEDLHEKFGFNENVEVSVNYGNYRVVGHIDKLLNGIVYEFKTYREGYPINYLIAPACTQANIYAYLCGVDEYAIIIYSVAKRTFWGFINDADYTRAASDINKAIMILENKIEPRPTTLEWKCNICELRGVVCDRDNKG